MVVGSVILLGIAVVFFGTVWLKGARLGEEKMEVQARFLEIGQLLEGSNVKLRGVGIGRVEAIDLERGGGGVIVTMTIDREVPLPPDPVVLLSPESLFGDWQAEIYPRNRWPQYDYAEAPDPQVLPGYSLPDISRLTAVADRIAENLAVLTERVEEAFTEETALNIQRAIENIEDVSAQLTGLVTRQSGSLDNLTASLEQTSGTINETAVAIRDLVRQVEGATAGGEIGEIIGNVSSATAQLDSLSVELLAMSSELRSTTVSADSAFGSLNRIMASVEAGEGTLGMLVQDTALYAELVESNLALQALVADIMRNPRRYINLQVF